MIFSDINFENKEYRLFAWACCKIKLMVIDTWSDGAFLRNIVSIQFKKLSFLGISLNDKQNNLKKTL